ncbi:MAG: aspartate-semialdehyde dehydrogenase [Zestosphaera tikiterensis]|uniref:aspartate-semialdehyde dehydrogenase n=1 Tax=Zestosphaera tikiterensis TaxID=1973259 RepID=A0A2R7Y7J7_9CREN|nr:MAG: aspartate-semialdehyde dehydrogenase [Zestosphaera tikiterensis]
MDKLKVGVLGATGLVGQRFVSLLYKHPWFELSFLTASEKKSGVKYGEAVNWLITSELPDDVSEVKLIKNDLEDIRAYKPDIVFSALPPEVAVSIEPLLLINGIHVVSNASNMRLEHDIPLLNPEVNADHIGLVQLQRTRGWRGYLLKVPNCSTAILTLSLKPIMDILKIRNVFVTTLQAVSGAGLTGVPSMSIIDNVIPYIQNEEEKIENETLKILGSYTNGVMVKPKINVSASCTRVPVIEGHTEIVFVEFEGDVDLDVGDVRKSLREFKSNKVKGLGLPTAPEEPVVVVEALDRPQPRLDRLVNNGMAVVVGRVRVVKPLNLLKYVVVGNNLVRGAAGTGVLIAELLTHYLRRVGDFNVRS